MPGALAPCCQEVHDVDIDTSSLLAPRSACVTLCTFSHRLLNTAAFCWFPITHFLCSFHCHRVVSPAPAMTSGAGSQGTTPPLQPGAALSTRARRAESTQSIDSVQL